MFIRATDLTGPALNWAVAKALDKFVIVGPSLEEGKYIVRNRAGWKYEPSENWDQGGPIIDAEGITVGPAETDPFKPFYGPADSNVGPWKQRFFGPTYLVAAMRWFVATKLSVEVDVPNELRI